VGCDSAWVARFCPIGPLLALAAYPLCNIPSLTTLSTCRGEQLLFAETGLLLKNERVGGVMLRMVSLVSVMFFVLLTVSTAPAFAHGKQNKDKHQHGHHHGSHGQKPPVIDPGKGDGKPPVIVDPIRPRPPVVVRDHRRPRPVIRDHRDASNASGGTVVTSTPVVRDHRSPASDPIVRDHRVARPVVRDHRTPKPIVNTPVVRDHRTPKPVTSSPIIRDHRDASNANGGTTVTSRPVIRDHRSSSSSSGAVIRDHRG
jgi:hypothetical protein